MERLPKFPDEKLLAESLKSPAALEKYEKLFLGREIKKCRRKIGMKQSILAKKLGTSQSSVARMEAGKQNFTIGILVKLSFALGKKLSVKFF
jgi:ribosome-binding protein aMBF1 (putative translation factor)